MRPISRETIVDRRQPALRWSAVFAGAAVGVALWVLLQLFGMGAGLSAADLDDYGSLRTAGIGATIASMLAPVIALFVGGIVAGRLATTFDQKVGAMHGLVTWSIASLVGFAAVALLVHSIGHGAASLAYANYPIDNVMIDPNLRAHELADAADKTGKIFLGAGLTLVLSLATSVVGGLLGARRLVSRRHTTQEVPVVPPPAEPPADAPHVGAP